MRQSNVSILLVVLVLMIAGGISSAGDIVISTGGITVDGTSVVSESSGIASQVSTGCVQGRGDVSTVERSLNDFDAIALKGAFKVAVFVGAKPRIVLKGEENILSEIMSVVEGRALEIAPKRPICNNREIEVEIYARSVSKLSSMGMAEVTVRNVSGPRLALLIDGNSTVRVEGRTDSLEVDIAGNGKLLAQQLQADAIRVVINGVGDAYLQVEKELDVRITGIGKVIYSGNPEKVNKTISGIGTVEQY